VELDLKDIDIQPSPSPLPHHCLSPAVGYVSTDTKEDDGIPEITHGVVFKYIGAHKEMDYQHTLVPASRNKNDGKTVSVNLKPEPDNPFDSNAVAFICQTDENAEWKRIGYVVRVATSEVLDTINSKKKNNTDITFAWIKYIPYYKNRAGMPE